MKYRKLLKLLPTGFANEADEMSPDELQAAIVQAETNILEIERAKEQDEKLAALREQMQDLTAGYTDGIKTQRAKISYMLLQLEAGGKLPEAEEN